MGENKNNMTIGEQIDSLNIESIIRMDQFISLTVTKGFGKSPDYWEIRMDSIKKDGEFFSIFGTKVSHPVCLFFKEKK